MKVCTIPLQVMIDNLDELEGHETLKVSILEANIKENTPKKLELVDENGMVFYSAIKF